jgi:hypothetical protein
MKHLEITQSCQQQKTAKQRKERIYEKNNISITNC